MNAFQGGYKRPGTMSDLHSLIQKIGETLRHFMQRFSHAAHNIPDAADAAIIEAFSASIRDIKMLEELNMHMVHTVNELYTLADLRAKAEEGHLAPERARKAGEEPESSGKKKRPR